MNMQSSFNWKEKKNSYILKDNFQRNYLKYFINKINLNLLVNLNNKLINKKEVALSYERQSRNFNFFFTDSGEVFSLCFFKTVCRVYKNYSIIIIAIIFIFIIVIIIESAVIFSKL